MGAPGRAIDIRWYPETIVGHGDLQVALIHPGMQPHTEFPLAGHRSVVDRILKQGLDHHRGHPYGTCSHIASDTALQMLTEARFVDHEIVLDDIQFAG